jgi:hypothetical protein
MVDTSLKICKIGTELRDRRFVMSKIKEMYEAGLTDNYSPKHAVTYLGKDYVFEAGLSFFADSVSLYVDSEFNALLLNYYFRNSKVSIKRAGGAGYEDIIIVNVEK